MGHWLARHVCHFLPLVAALMAITPLAAEAASNDQARRDYAMAVQAMALGDWKTVSQLRSGLNDYPLAIYLDYYRLTRGPDAVSAAQAVAFLEASAGTPLANRFLGKYLSSAGQDRRWEDLLAVKAEEPNSVELKCYYYRAQLARGSRDIALEGAERLWVHGESRPKSCDPLFDAWMAAGGLTDDIVWTRLLNTFDARQPSLMRYVGRKGSAALTPWSNTLLDVYANPESVARQNLPADDARSADIAVRGLAYLARYSPPKAQVHWATLQPRLSFSPEQVRTVEYAIARQSLFARVSQDDDWLAAALSRLEDDTLVGIRLRQALAEQDWDALARYLDLLSADAMEENVWRYWRAVSQERTGEKAAANAMYEQLAAERDYYGFLAADRLKRPYAFKHQRPQRAVDSSSITLPAIARIEELKFHGDDALAHSEWYTLLQQTAEEALLTDLMLLAAAKGWDRMAIDAATQAQAWDALNQRFPTAYSEIFERHATTQNVSGTELMSIARRESAFYPKARSPVGARGLMQIMPATGKAVASSLGVSHTTARLYDVDHNVKLGSAYYRQLLDRFGGNRVFALAGYNAGPHRVDRWRRESADTLPVTQWIETIPYRETRNYVQAVLAYNVVFQYLLGNTQNLFTVEEQRDRY